MKLWGIDYGSKLAGTTVIGQLENGVVQLFCSEKKKDADQFILKKAALEQPQAIFLDAPLSLPNVYLGVEGYDNYFYRKADKIVKGMSPMFLGGLTARAMRLKEILTALDITVYETYPALHARAFDLKSLNYKKQKQYLSSVVDLLFEQLPFQFDKNTVQSWHHVDALLATYSAYRFSEHQHEIIGDKNEGQIYF